MKQSVAQRAIRYVRAKAPYFIPRMTELQPNGEQSLRFWQRGGGYDYYRWSPEQTRPACTAAYSPYINPAWSI
jgi:hypothetical protein